MKVDRIQSGLHVIERLGVWVMVWLMGIGIVVGIASPVGAFTYVSATDNFASRITHPAGYDGLGGVLNVTIGIAPDTPRTEHMIEPILNVVNTWNGLTPTLGNVKDSTTESITSLQYDFESVLLHEVGHALGLGHVNLASESDLTGEDMDYTKSGQGRNNKWDLDAGDDGIIGSADDERRDDVNFNWFEIDSNNPFEMPGVIDSTTYTINLDDLPNGDSFSANASRDVGIGLLGQHEQGFLSEAVMQQGTFIGEVQRELSFDDVAGVRYAQSGLDEVAGTDDDYTIVLEYVGIDLLADIVVTFDRDTDFASTNFITNRITGSFTHVNMSSSTITFNDLVNWHYTLPEGCIEGDINCDGHVGLLDLDIMGRHYNLTGMSRYEGDLSGNGTVSLLDLDILGEHFGDMAVPEPGVGALLVAGGLVLWRRQGGDH